MAAVLSDATNRSVTATSSHNAKPTAATAQTTSTHPQLSHLQFYTSSEVAFHSLPTDCWVTLYSRVLNLTALLQHHLNNPQQGDSPAGHQPHVDTALNTAHLCHPIVKHAGHDLSHWFTQEDSTDDSTLPQLTPKTHMCPTTHKRIPYTPAGRYLHLPLAPNVSATGTTTGLQAGQQPWWNDTQYIVGRVTSKTRVIEVLNMLTGESARLEVCSEDSLSVIVNRYEREVNSNASNAYVWKFLGRELEMDKTLSENEIFDDEDEMAELHINADQYVPLLHVYYTDAL